MGTADPRVVHCHAPCALPQLPKALPEPSLPAPQAGRIIILESEGLCVRVRCQGRRAGSPQPGDAQDLLGAL